MKQMKAYKLLSLRHADQKLEAWRAFANTQPTCGWIAYVRESLSLSVSGLAKLLGIKQSSALTMEKREVQKTITIQTLEKAANAMGCELVYAFVPKSSLSEFVHQKQIDLVNQMIEQTSHTMTLENQGLDTESLNQQKQILLDDISNQPLSFLWRNL